MVIGRLAVPGMAVSMVALLSLGWLLSGHLVQDAPPLAVAAGRTTASFVAISLAAMAMPRIRPGVRAATSRPRAIVALAFLGFFAYYSGTLIGTAYLGASRVGLIVSLLPCLTFLIGVVAFREPATRRKVVGTTLAVFAACGDALADGRANGPGTGAGTLIGGGLLALGGTFTYALYGYVYRQRLAHVAPVAALPAITGVGAVMLGAVAVLFVPLGRVSVADWAGIAVLGAFLTAPVFVISHELILRKGPLFTSAVALAVPFLVRAGAWMLGWEKAPEPVIVVLLVVCAAGVRLTVAERVQPSESARAEGITPERLHESAAAGRAALPHRHGREP